MGQMQKKIIDQLRQIAKDARLEFVDQPAGFGNKGTAYVQAAGFETVVEVRYDFADTYVTVVLIGAGVAQSPTALADKGARQGTVRASVQLSMLGYGKQDQMARLFDIFKAILAESASARMVERLTDLMTRQAHVEVETSDHRYQGVISAVVPDGKALRFGLFVDVTSPAGTPRQPRPVVVEMPARVTEIVVAELDTSEPPAFGGGEPDYSVNHVS